MAGECTRFLVSSFTYVFFYLINEAQPFWQANPEAENTRDKWWQVTRCRLDCFPAFAISSTSCKKNWRGT